MLATYFLRLYLTQDVQWFRKLHEDLKIISEENCFINLPTESITFAQIYQQFLTSLHFVALQKRCPSNNIPLFNCSIGLHIE